MAIANDSFGSPSLGEGIALQAQPKDNTGNLIRLIMSEQQAGAKKAKALQDQAGLDEKEFYKRYGRLSTHGYLPAFAQEARTQLLSAIDLYGEYKSKGIPNITLDPEFNSKWAAIQQNLENLQRVNKLTEEELKKTQVQSADYVPNSKFINATLSPEAWKAAYEDVYKPANEPSMVQVPDVAYNKTIKNATDLITPRITKYVQSKPRNIEDGKFVITKEESQYIDSEIENVWNNIVLQTTSQNMFKSLYDNAKTVDPNVTIDEIVDAKKREFKAQFKSMFKESAQQIRVQDKGTTAEPTGFSYSKVEIAPTEYKPIVESTLTEEKFRKAMFDAIKKGRTAAAGTFENALYSKYGKGKAETQWKEYSTQQLYDSSVADLGKDFNQARQNIWNKAAEEAAKESANFNTQANKLIVTGTEGTDQKIDITTPEGVNKKAILKGYIDDGKNKWFSFSEVAQAGAAGGQSEYLIRYTPKLGAEVATAINKNKGGKVVQVGDADAFWDNLMKQQGATKFEEGGLVEPKSISKKFHNKSQNLTKFVYSDGTEQIFKGII